MAAWVSQGNSCSSETGGMKLGPEWPDSQLGGLEVTTLLHSPVLYLSPRGPVTEPVTPDTHFFLVLPVNLRVLYRASQRPHPCVLSGERTWFSPAGMA